MNKKTIKISHDSIYKHAYFFIGIILVLSLIFIGSVISIVNPIAGSFMLAIPTTIISVWCFTLSIYYMIKEDKEGD